MSFVTTPAVSTLSTLTIYVCPSYHPLDWTSPQRLVRALTMTGFYSSTGSPESVSFNDGFGKTDKITVWQ